MIQMLKECDSLNSIICINVSRPQKNKIPKQIRSVPTIMDQNGQLITGSFARSFITTVLPQMKNSDPLKRPRGGPGGSQVSGPRPQISKSVGGSNPSSDGLLSANFGTEFSGFSYLPGRNDLAESFTDFEYLNQKEGPRGGHGIGVKGGIDSQDSKVVSSKKADELQKRLDSLKAQRSLDVGR